MSDKTILCFFGRITVALCLCVCVCAVTCKCSLTEHTLTLQSGACIHMCPIMVHVECDLGRLCLLAFFVIVMEV